MNVLSHLSIPRWYRKIKAHKSKRTQNKEKRITQSGNALPNYVVKQQLAGS
jgi:hypothetical protein